MTRAHILPLPGVILAGGRATRMGGGDKGLLMVGGQSLLARVIDRLAPQCAPLAISANGDPARLAGFGLPVLPDPLPEFPGPLAGVLAGLDWAAGQDATAIITAATDTPFFPLDLAARLQAAASSSGLALAATTSNDRTRPQPTFGLWPVSLRDALRDALISGQRRVGDFAQAQGAGLASWPASPNDPFFNINTPEDMALAETLFDIQS